VAERVQVVRRPLTAADRDVQEHLVAGVGDAVEGLREQCRGARERSCDALGRGDAEVGRQRHKHAEQAVAAWLSVGRGYGLSGTAASRVATTKLKLSSR
jgi:hypothetical protein